MALWIWAALSPPTGDRVLHTVLRAGRPPIEARPGLQTLCRSAGSMGAATVMLAVPVSAPTVAARLAVVAAAAEAGGV
jgi:hypothetical protein